jgi:hypothetical protein
MLLGAVAAARQRAAAWSPASLLSTGLGIYGFAFDPTDLATLYQDAAGTTPAAVDGPVGLMLDTGPWGLDVAQPDAGFRPTLRTPGGVPCLEFAEGDHLYSTASILSPYYERVFDTFVRLNVGVPATEREIDPIVWQGFDGANRQFMHLPFGLLSDGEGVFGAVYRRNGLGLPAPASSGGFYVEGTWTSLRCLDVVDGAGAGTMAWWKDGGFHIDADYTHPTGTISANMTRLSLGVRWSSSSFATQLASQYVGHMGRSFFTTRAWGDGLDAEALARVHAWLAGTA